MVRYMSSFTLLRTASLQFNSNAKLFNLSPRIILRPLRGPQPRVAQLARCFTDSIKPGRATARNITFRAQSHRNGSPDQRSFSTSSIRSNEQERMTQFDPEEHFRIKPESEEQAKRRIHILGIGNVGMFIAHALRGSPDSPPVSLLLHRLALARTWRRSNQEVNVMTQGQIDPRGGFDAELAIPFFRKHGKNVSAEERLRLETLVQGEVPLDVPLHEEVEELPEDEIFKLNEGPPIHNVILTVKAARAVPALLAIKHRLTADSTVLFLQNGMGVVEEVNEEVFPDPAKRPNYLLGINSHGLHHIAAFQTNHVGFGTISLGMPLSPALRKASSSSSAAEDAATSLNDLEMAPSSRYLLRTLTQIPVLSAVGLSPTELFKAQLDKLAINCVVNPLTALLGCQNGHLLYNKAVTRCWRLLLSEISSIFIRLPELQGLPNIATRFSPERLETIAVSVARKTRRNVSSMLADVRQGKQTEIEYLNGYVVKRGEEIGMHAGFNYFIQQLVEGKQQMKNRMAEDKVPFVQNR